VGIKEGRIAECGGNLILKCDYVIILHFDLDSRAVKYDDGLLPHQTSGFSEAFATLTNTQIGSPRSRQSTCEK